MEGFTLAEVFVLATCALDLQTWFRMPDAILMPRLVCAGTYASAVTHGALAYVFGATTEVSNVK